MDSVVVVPLPIFLILDFFLDLFSSSFLFILSQRYFCLFFQKTYHSDACFAAVFHVSASSCHPFRAGIRVVGRDVRHHCQFTGRLGSGPIKIKDKNGKIKTERNQGFHFGFGIPGN